jgi:hypothetical protein
MLGIGCYDGKCFMRRAEQDVIDSRLILEGDPGDRCRDSEYNVKILYWQKLGLTCGQPFGPSQTLALGAMSIAA